VIARVGCRKTQRFGDGSFFTWQFESTAFSAEATVEDTTAALLAQFEEMVVAASSRVRPALLLLLFSLGRGADDDDGDWGVLNAVFGHRSRKETVNTLEISTSGSDDEHDGLVDTNLDRSASAHEHQTLLRRVNNSPSVE
jgi:hypothetical protein